MILNNLTFNGTHGAVINEAGFTTRGETAQPTYDNAVGSPLAPSMLMDFSGGNYNSCVVRNAPGQREIYFSFDVYFEALTADWTRNYKPFMLFEEASGYARMCYLGFEDRTGELRVETYVGGGPSDPRGTLYSSNFGGPITLEMINGKRVTFKVGIRIPNDLTQMGYWKTHVIIDGVERVAIDGPVMFGCSDIGIQWYGAYCSTQNSAFQPGVASRIRMTNLVIADAESDIFAPVPAPTPAPTPTTATRYRLTGGQRHVWADNVLRSTHSLLENAVEEATNAHYDGAVSVVIKTDDVSVTKV